MQDDSDKALLRHVRSAIAANRQPGLHFPGFFLELEPMHVDKEGSHLAVAHGPHCANADGSLNMSAIALLTDIGMGLTVRAHLTPTTRTATTVMQLHFTGRPVHTDLECRSSFEGFFHGSHASLGNSSCVLTAGGEVIGHGTASFATPPTPPGVTMHAAPMHAMGPKHHLPPLPVSQMTEDERRIMKEARAALKKASPQRSFVEHLWAQDPKPKEGGGAAVRVRIGPHVGNRVGHMQGGVLFGAAAACAIAAVPGRSLLTSASAWYISPGTGSSLAVRSRLLQLGRTIAVVRTEVIGENKRPVLEMVTSHVF